MSGSQAGPGGNNPSNLSASISIGFVDAEVESQQGIDPTVLGRGNGWLLENSNKVIPPPKGPAIGRVGAYFRVHPSAAGLNLQCSSGSISSSAAGLHKRAYETISFNNSTAGTLRYPRPSNVKLEVVGRLIPTAAGQGGTTVALNYDSTKNVVEASHACVGMVKVEYDAPFDLWLAMFNQEIITPFNQEVITPFNARKGNEEDDTPPTVDPMLVIGRRQTSVPPQDPSEIVCSITLNPPDWGNRADNPDGNKEGFGPGGAQMDGTANQMPKLSLFIDPQNPVRLIKSASGDSKPAAGCGVICVPGVTPAYQFTAGNFTTAKPTKIDTAQEMVSFSGGMSANLRYQPQSSINVVNAAPFIDAWGVLFSPRIAKPGETVRMVEWGEGGRSYRNPRNRIVNVDELVVCDTLGNAIPAYGVVQATYTTTGILNDFIFEYDEVAGQFKTCWIVATYKDQTATLQVTGPSLKGVKKA